MLPDESSAGLAMAAGLARISYIGPPPLLDVCAGAPALPVPLPGRYGINYAPGEKTGQHPAQKWERFGIVPAQDLFPPVEKLWSRLAGIHLEGPVVMHP